MVERIEAMPAGTIGFKVVSDLTADDYRDQIEPALKAAAEAGEVRLLFEIDRGFGMDAGAVIEDAKTGLKLGLGHMKAWKRT
ncbi:MAG TPA: STAS/SEC14 domain-containing protein, partial [Solirubrobacterales bacterium]